MKRTVITLLSALALVASVSAAQAPAPAGSTARTLDIYIPDTEGGEAMLFVTPGGETVMLDSGNPGERDHARIMDILRVAGVTRIDHMITTHYHLDHVGGLLQLAGALPIAHYVDHGPSSEEREQVAGFQAAYAELWGKAKHTVVKPGDKLPIAGVDWTIVASNGDVLGQPLPGAGQDNAVACAASQPPKPFPAADENARSVGSLVTFGQFKVTQLGDLFWAKELDLMCPQNRMGTVDLYLVSHHGLDSSGSPALVHGLQPRVAVMQNGTRKGGAVATNTTIFTSPGLEDLWQLHWSYNAMIELNPAGLFIANVDDAPTIAGILTAPLRGGGPGGRQGGRAGAPAGGGAPAAAPAAPQAPAAGVAGAPAAPAPGDAAVGRRGGGPGGGRGGQAAAAHTPAHYIKISAQEDGTFTVTNSRNGFSKTYSKR